jgi:hypothetical protein
LNNEKAPDVPEAFDGDWKRTIRKKESLDVVSSDSSSEEI